MYSNGESWNIKASFYLIRDSRHGFTIPDGWRKIRRRFIRRRKVMYGYWEWSGYRYGSPDNPIQISTSQQYSTDHVEGIKQGLPSPRIDPCGTPNFRHFFRVMISRTATWWHTKREWNSIQDRANSLAASLNVPVTSYMSSWNKEGN